MNNLNFKNYHITNMIIMNGIEIICYKYNVFDLAYNFICSITCECECDFVPAFNNYLLTHKI